MTQAATAVVRRWPGRTGGGTSRTPGRHGGWARPMGYPAREGYLPRLRSAKTPPTTGRAWKPFWRLDTVSYQSVNATRDGEVCTKS